MMQQTEPFRGAKITVQSTSYDVSIVSYTRNGWIWLLKNTPFIGSFSEDCVRRWVATRVPSDEGIFMVILFFESPTSGSFVNFYKGPKVLCEKCHTFNVHFTNYGECRRRRSTRTRTACQIRDTTVLARRFVKYQLILNKSDSKI